MRGSLYLRCYCVLVTELDRRRVGNRVGARPAVVVGPVCSVLPTSTRSSSDDQISALTHDDRAGERGLGLSIALSQPRACEPRCWTQTSHWRRRVAYVNVTIRAGRPFEPFLRAIDMVCLMSERPPASTPTATELARYARARVRTERAEKYALTFAE